MNRILDQITSFWSQLGLNQKFSLVLATVAVIFGMGVILMWSARPRMSLLYGNLAADEMADVIGIVQENGVEYEISGGGSTVMVPSTEVYSLRMALASAGLPSGNGVGFEIFDKGNFGISDFVQRTNYLRAVQGELARTISQMDGVRNARVMVVIPESRLVLGEMETHPTASVFIDTGGRKLNINAVDSIRFLVANSVEGLDVNSVAVIDSRGNVLSEALRSDSTLGSANSQLKYRKELEDYYSNKVESMLTPIVGPGSVVARVSVEVNTNAQTRTDVTYDPDSAVVRSQSQTEEKNITDERKPSAAAGTASNVANEGGDTANASEAVASTEGTIKNRSMQYEINSSRVETVQAPGEIQRLSVAVFIAQKSDPETGEAIERGAPEMDRIRRMVANAIGLDPATDIGTLVTVDEILFSYAEQMMVVSETSMIDKVLENSDLIRNFLALGIAIGMFTVFIRMIKRYRPEAVQIQTVNDSEKETKNITPRLTPELLNELIASKPDNVSTALQDWVNQGEQ